MEESLLDQKKIIPILNFYAKKLIVANDGVEGLEQFKKFKPDIIVTDTKMAKLDGISLIKKIKKIDSSVKVIITVKKRL